MKKVEIAYEGKELPVEIIETIHRIVSPYSKTDTITIRVSDGNNEMSDLYRSNCKIFSNMLRKLKAGNIAHVDPVTVAIIYIVQKDEDVILFVNRIIAMRTEEFNKTMSYLNPTSTERNIITLLREKRTDLLRIYKSL